jgi:hypothetical protein
LCEAISVLKDNRTPAPTFQTNFPLPMRERARPVECTSRIPRGMGEGVIISL